MFVMNGEDLERFSGDSVDDNVGKAGESDLPLQGLTADVMARWGPGVGRPRRALRCCSQRVQEPGAQSLDSVSYQSCASTTSAVASEWNRMSHVTGRVGLRPP